MLSQKTSILHTSHLGWVSTLDRGTGLDLESVPGCPLLLRVGLNADRISLYAVYVTNKVPLPFPIRDIPVRPCGNDPVYTYREESIYISKEHTKSNEQYIFKKYLGLLSLWLSV